MGSSPRMRGAQGQKTGGGSRPGSSPRMRGAPPRTSSSASRTGDHPRVCGEHVVSFRSHPRRVGSSPRMRGALLARESPRVQAGIIPAYAGSTTPRARRFRCRRDHPRVCGEHCALLSQSLPVPGSSPRMRGALEPCRVAALRPGIIPAYAGSTRRRASGSAPRRDHPRVCGEHRVLKYGRWPREGSSPRMRGARADGVARDVGERIIPAYAGSTWHPPSSAFPCWDHPRVCGEHSRWAATRCARWGSSPRMRGAPPREGGGVPGRGIIPAYAGSTGRPA